MLDASAAICWASPDEAPPAALTDAVVAGACVAPALWVYEIHNVLLVLQRRKRLTRDGHAAASAALAALGVELETPAWGHVTHDVLHLARKHALSVHDAAYLEWASRRDYRWLRSIRRCARRRKRRRSRWFEPPRIDPVRLSREP